MKKVVAIDHDWKEFVQHIMEKIQEHATWYQARRAQILEAFNAKPTELDAAKKEVSQASQTLVETMQDAPQFPQGPNPLQDVTQMSTFAATVASVPTVDLDAEEGDSQEPHESVDMDQDQPEGSEGQEGVKKEGRRVRAQRPQPFPNNRSPKKVTQHNLKSCDGHAAPALCRGCIRPPGIW